MAGLENLSAIDFEDLCRDLAKVETGMRFEAFGPGPDGGIDGRHAEAGKKIILQAKHYINSSFSDLKKAATKEKSKIVKIKPSRYLFFTSHSLTVTKKNTLQSILGDLIQKPGDIWGRDDIDEALKRHPEIEKAHIKLWLSSTAVLEKLLHSGLEAFTQATKEEILDELRVYARNPSFDEALERLEKEKILIVSGPPGVGKTTLARMVSYFYIEQGWSFVAINSLEDVFEKIDDKKPTIFFFDDFLGRISLDRQSLMQRDSAFAMFVKRIRRSKNARFVLTTRAHIFEDARTISDYIDDEKIQLAKYLLDVGVYTRRIKSQILFNHLSVSELSQDHYKALLGGDWLKKIVDHKNYNPRVIASASSDCLDEVEPKDYPAYIYNALEHPDLIWGKPFSALDMRCKNLLYAIYFGSEFGSEIDILRVNFENMHRAVCKFYSQATDPDDFENALRILESGFVNISGKSVSFVNPSLRDFLKAYLIQGQLLKLLSENAMRADWAQNVWSHSKGVFSANKETLEDIASSFLLYIGRIEQFPTMKKKNDGASNVSYPDDLCLTDRISFLLGLFEVSSHEKFISRAAEISQSNNLYVLSWRDGRNFPEIFWHVKHFVPEDSPHGKTLLKECKRHVLKIVEDGVGADDLVSIMSAIDEYMEDAEILEIQDAIDGAVDFELEETSDAISHLDSEQSLSEQLEHIEALGRLTGRNIDAALQTVNERLYQFQEPDYSEERVNISSRSSGRATEVFSDDCMRSLFSTLLE